MGRCIFIRKKEINNLKILVLFFKSAVHERITRIKMEQKINIVKFNVSLGGTYRCSRKLFYSSPEGMPSAFATVRHF
jgi:hypothetical protein